MSSFKIIGFLIFEFAVFQPARFCAGGVGGGQLLTNPSLQLTFHPPTSWTFPEADATTLLTYFPGQSMTETEAKLRANADLNSAVLAGLDTLQISTIGLKITPTFTPKLINDCQKAATPSPVAGKIVGFEESGAITQLITLTAILQPPQCIARAYTGASGTDVITRMENIQEASVKIDGITLSEYQAQLLAAKVSQYLMLNSKVDFTQEITVA